MIVMKPVADMLTEQEMAEMRLFSAQKPVCEGR